MARVTIEETVTVPAEAERLWDVLFDPLPLKPCLPGAADFRKTGENAYALTIELHVPVISGAYAGTFHVADHRPHDWFQLAAKAAGPLGNVRALADVQLTPIARGTRAKIRIHAELSGVLGIVGPPAAKVAGAYLIDRFFECVNHRLEELAKETDSAAVASPVAETDVPKSDHSEPFAEQ